MKRLSVLYSFLERLSCFVVDDEDGDSTSVQGSLEMNWQYHNEKLVKDEFRIILEYARKNFYFLFRNYSFWKKKSIACLNKLCLLFIYLFIWRRSHLLNYEMTPKSIKFTFTMFHNDVDNSVKGIKYSYSFLVISVISRIWSIIN